MVDVVVDGASVNPEEKAGFPDGVVLVRNYRCVLQMGHNQLFYAVSYEERHSTAIAHPVG